MAGRTATSHYRTQIPHASRKSSGPLLCCFEKAWASIIYKKKLNERINISGGTLRQLRTLLCLLKGSTQNTFSLFWIRASTSSLFFILFRIQSLAVTFLQVLPARKWFAGLLLFERESQQSWQFRPHCTCSLSSERMRNNVRLFNAQMLSTFLMFAIFFSR